MIILTSMLCLRCSIDQWKIMDKLRKKDTLFVKQKNEVQIFDFNFQDLSTKTLIPNIHWNEDMEYMFYYLTHYNIISIKNKKCLLLQKLVSAILWTTSWSTEFLMLKHQKDASYR